MKPLFLCLTVLLAVFRMMHGELAIPEDLTRIVENEERYGAPVTFYKSMDFEISLKQPESTVFEMLSEVPCSGSKIIFTAIAKEDTYFFPAHTPLTPGPLVSDIFKFSPEATYTGVRALFNFAHLEEVHLMKGDEMQTEVNLCEFYELEPGQAYTVQFSNGLFLKSNTISLDIPKETRYLKKGKKKKKTKTKVGRKRDKSKKKKKKKKKKTKTGKGKSKKQSKKEKCSMKKQSKKGQREKCSTKKQSKKKQQQQCFVENNVTVVDGIKYLGCGEAAIAKIQLGLAQIDERISIWSYDEWLLDADTAVTFNFLFWFAEYENLAKVQEAVAAIKTYFDRREESVVFKCPLPHEEDPESLCFPGVEAWVDALQTDCGCGLDNDCGQINVCNAFTEYQQRPGLVLVHEASHFRFVAGTLDLCAGLFECSELARLRPENTTRSADSYGIAYDLYRRAQTAPSAMPSTTPSML